MNIKYRTEYLMHCVLCCMIARSGDRKIVKYGFSNTSTRSHMLNIVTPTSGYALYVIDPRQKVVHLHADAQDSQLWNTRSMDWASRGSYTYSTWDVSGME